MMPHQAQCVETLLDIDYFKSQTAHLAQKKGYPELLKLLADYHTITDPMVLKYNTECLISALKDFIQKNAIKDIAYFNKISDHLSGIKLRLDNENPLNVDYFTSQTTHLAHKKAYPELLKLLTEYNTLTDIDAVRLTIDRLLIEFEHFMRKRTTQDLEHIRITRNYLQRIQTQLAHENPLNLGFFESQTAHLAQEKGYRELLNLIVKYNTSTNFDALKSNVVDFINHLDSFMQATANQNLAYLNITRQQLETIQIRLDQRDHTFAEIPKKIHCIQIGSAVKAIQQQQLALWQQLHQSQGHQLTVWYDSDALLVKNMHQLMNDAAAEKIFKANPKISEASFFVAMRTSMYQLKQQAHDLIQRAIASGASADAARIDLLEQYYGQNRAMLLKIRQENQASLQAIANAGIKVQDLRTIMSSEWLLKPHYDRELNWRSDINAATQMVCLQLLAQQGGMYSAFNLLPPLSARFWHDVTLLTLTHQGKTITDQQQLQQAILQLQKEWQTNQSAQLYTWQLLRQNNPDWMPELTTTAQTVQTYKEKITPALANAIERYSMAKPRLTEVFTPLNPIILAQDTLKMATSPCAVYTTDLLAAHPNSAMVQAVIQQIDSNYQLLNQIEQEFEQKQLNRQERDLVFDRLMNYFPPLGHDVIQAVVDYYNQGLLVGSDATTILSGAGALKQGIAAYAKKALLPASMIAPALLSLPAEQTQSVILDDATPRLGLPLNDNQAANTLYQHYKAKAEHRHTGSQHYTTYSLIVGKDSAQQTELPLLTSEVLPFLPTQLFKILEPMVISDSLSMIAGALNPAAAATQSLITQIKTTAEIAALIYHHTTHAYHLVENEILSYTELTLQQRITSGARAFMGMQQQQKIIESSQRGQMEKIKAMSLKYFRQLLKGDLKDYFDTVVYGNLALSEPDATTGNRQLFYLPNEINASHGINHNSIPSGNYLIYKSDPKKGVLFTLGHGHDEITGVQNKPNQFLLTCGQKIITGGHCDDVFIIDMPVEQSQQQIMWSKKHNTPPYQITGGSGNNALIIKADLMAAPEECATEMPIAEPICYSPYPGYAIDLQQGTVRVREQPVEQFNSYSTPLMTVRNIKQIEVKTTHPTKNIIRGSDQDNVFIMHDGDKIYTQGGNNVVVIQGGGDIYAGTGCNAFFINNSINQQGEPDIRIHREIESDNNKTSTIHLPVNCHQLTPWRFTDNNLVVELGEQANSYKLILTDVYQTKGKQRILAMQNALFFTHDGWILKPQFEEKLVGDQNPSLTFATTYSKAWDQRPSASPTPPLSKQYQLQPNTTLALAELSSTTTLQHQASGYSQLVGSINSAMAEQKQGHVNKANILKLPAHDAIDSMIPRLRNRG